MTIEAKLHKPFTRTFTDLDALMRKHSLIGAISAICPLNRYMLVTAGPGRGIGTEPLSSFRTTDQENSGDQYIIFENKCDLLEWMKGEKYDY